MTRGKYAARAANRLAEIDAGLVAELREKLAAVTAERDAARVEVKRLTIDRDASARSVAEKIAAGVVNDLNRQLAASKEARETDRRSYAAGVSRVMRTSGVKAPASVWADLLGVFGLKGKEMALFMGKEGGHPRRIGQMNSDELRREDARAARKRGLSNAVAVRLEDDYGVTVALDEIIVDYKP